jgi:Rho-binding antiterminator
MADEERYDPVSCDYHDQLEAASVKKRDVELEFDEQGVRQRERGRIGDVFTRDGAEFVRLDKAQGSAEIRLDRIVSLREIAEG